MSYSQMVEILRKKHKEKIVLINAGAFFIAVGEDAVFLNNKLKLKCTCFKNNICKVGVPINSIDKYLEKIRKLDYSYVIYNFNKQQEALTLMQEYEGKPNRTKRNNINCLMCKGVSKYKDEYKHGGYSVFYISEPKIRRIEKSKYIDRIVHRWYVNSFMEPFFVPQFVNTSYACLKKRGMHKATLDLQNISKRKIRIRTK